MKKIISLILLLMIMFNFICGNYAYAEEPNSQETDNPLTSTDGLQYEENSTLIPELLEQGTSSVKNGDSSKVQNSHTSFGVSIIGFITGILARIVNVVVLQIDLLMSQFTVTTIYDEGKAKGDLDQFWFTIDKVVFNRIALFNINYFDIPEDDVENPTYEVGSTVIEQNTSNIAIKKQVSKVYYICRMIALAMSLVVLIYIGIRMAISTVASDQAKYKKMLMSWIESLVILFVMVYIMVFIINIGESLTGVFYDIRNDLFNKNVPGMTGKYGVFEDTIRTSTMENVLSLAGLEVTLWSILYWFLLYMEFKFLWTYLKRFLLVGFLIVISPFIIITYSIDKAGDGKAQAFSKWLKEFLTNVLIQPLHALLYLIFVFSANAIAIEAPLVGIAFLYAMTQAERIIKRLFDIEGLTTIRGLDHFGKK